MVFRQFSASGLAACILLLAIEPSAQANGTVIVLGPGGESCGSWISHRSMNIGIGDEDWVVGYLTAKEEDSSVAQAGDVAINTDADGIFGWIDNYCRSNPTVTLHLAADVLIVAIRPFVRDSQ